MHVVVTTIQRPTPAMVSLAAGLAERQGRLIIVGDSKGPDVFDLPAVDFLPLHRQQSMAFHLARALPTRHYARKNLGYLFAIAAGAELLVETDDDNEPIEGFFAPRQLKVAGRLVEGAGWCNAYRYFSDENIWPRGFPLELLRAEANCRLGGEGECDCLIQQGLADANPDVDAVYRMTQPLPMNFRQAAPLLLGTNCWCPFNSQNTTFFRDAFPLLYLPSYCSFRMTDIWRSFVAQRCLWAMGGRVGFMAATVKQDRNTHDLLADFSDEVSGYLHNRRIGELLLGTTLGRASTPAAVCDNLQACYTALVGAGLLDGRELQLLKCWRHDILTLLAASGR
jgi:hypothetical protein